LSSQTNKPTTSVTVNWNEEKEEQTLRDQLQREIPGHSAKLGKKNVQNVY
jgi:hypothetical protein